MSAVPALPVVLRDHGTRPADDPAVPFRDLLLDGAAVGPLLGARAGARGPLAVESCACVHAKYRPGISLRTVYRLQAGGREHWLAARSFAPDRAERALAKAAPAAVPSAALRPLTHVPELGAVFWAFPNDRKIADLRVLDGAPEIGRMLGRDDVRTLLVAWAAERAATARCVDASARVVAYAKVYAAGLAPRTAAIHAALRAGARAAGPHAPRLPRALACLPERHTVLLAPIAAPALLGLRGAARAEAMGRLGAALAVLHDLPLPAAAPRFDRLEPHRLRSAAEVIGRIRPDVAAAAADVVEALCATGAPPVEEPPASLHGDPHGGNVLVDGDRIALVDLDLAARGPAAADLGLVLAGLCQQRLLGLLDAAAERDLAARTLAGYAAVRPLPAHETLAWHTAAWLLARPALPAAVAGLARTGALRHLPALVDAAREALR